MTSLTTCERRHLFRFALGLSLIAAGSAGYVGTRPKTQSNWEGLTRAAVRRVSFDACLTASGESRCAQQTVVKCELENLAIRSKRSMYLAGGASTILEIVPNGTMVKKGDLLCRLDASEYEELVRVRALNVLSHHAEEVQTANALQSAELALAEYRDGLLDQELKSMKGRISLAEAQVGRASDRLAWSERLAAKGYVSRLQVANDRVTLLRSTLELKQAQTEFDTYRRFTAPKILVSLKAEVVKSRKWFDHEASDYVKSKDQFAHYRALVERCTIRAPHDGFAIYANGTFREEEERVIIEPGASVRQGQELFYLPNLSRMEVVAMLHDTIVDHVRPGMLARVRVEGSRGVVLEGHVEFVEDLPRRSFNDVTYYRCVIEFDVSPPGLLPKTSAEIEIQTGRCRDVLAVPSGAMSADRDRNVCYVVGSSGLERREVTPGLSNSDLIEVRKGLNEGESVVLNPPRVIDRSPGGPSRWARIVPKRPQSPRAAEPLVATRGDNPGERTGTDRVASLGVGE
jgi:HlyD family secretion protein